MPAEARERPIAAAEADRLFAPLAGARGVGIAVSGGADSLALMHLLAEWRARRAGDTAPEMAMRVLTVDHGLREAAAAEAADVARRAAALGLPHEILHRQGARPKSGIQAAARRMRYRLLGEACARHGLSHLVTAHHADDQAETLLLRLAHGSGLDGLGAMRAAAPRGPVTLARPLLAVPRARLEATLRARGQDWLDDPSNDDPSFARVRLRRLMPALAAEGFAAEGLAATAHRLARAAEALERYAAAAERELVAYDPAGFCRLDADGLAACPEETALRVVGRALARIGGGHPVRLERLERLFAALRTDGFRGATLAGCRVARAGAHLVVQHEARGPTPAPAVVAAGTSVLWDNRFRVRVSSAAMPELEVRALGADGLRQLRGRSRMRALPALAARTSAAAFRGDGLVAAPHLEAEPRAFSPEGVEIAFVGAASGDPPVHVESE